MLSLGDHHQAVAFLGFDMSLNHGALIALDKDGKLIGSAVLSTTQKDEKRPEVSRIPDHVLAHEDKATLSVKRLDWLKAWVQRSLHAINSTIGRRDLYIAIEDYAYAKAKGAHQLGEIGGIVRIVCAMFAQVRLHDPSTVKVFATGKGNASKDEVIAGVKQRWGVEPPPYAAATREDFCDAYTLAQMVRVEYLVRSGKVDLQGLPEEDRRNFLRVTPGAPVNLLDRPFVRLDVE